MIYTYIYLYISRRDVASGKQKGSFMDNRQSKKRCVLCGGVPNEINLYKTRQGFNGFLSEALLCPGCAERLYLDDSDIVEKTEGGG